MPALDDLNGPFLGSHAVSEGWLTRRELRSPLFVRVFRNAYVPAGLPMTHELKCRAVATVAPPEAVVTGWSAAAIHGFELAAARDPVEIILPEHVKFSAQRDVDIRRTFRGEIEGEPWHGIRLATPRRMVLDLLTNTRLHRSLPRVVGYADAIIRRDGIDIANLHEWLENRHDNGIVRARKALTLVDPRAESVPESELRVWLRLAGLDPVVQLEVLGGRYRLDLGFPEEMLAVEYDGAWHAEGEQPVADARRRAILESAGWAFLVVTKDWLYAAPHDVVATVQRALSCRR